MHLLKPTQPDLEESRINSLLSYYFKHRRAPGPPAALKQEPNGQKFDILDGHHRLVLADLFNIDEDLFLVEHAEDCITQDIAPGLNEEQIKETNERIKSRFNYVDHIAWNFKKNYPPTIKALREKYRVLRNEKSAEEFFRNQYLQFR